MAQCTGVTKGGKPCRSPALQGSRYCYQHSTQQRRGQIARISAIVALCLAILAVIADVTGVLSFLGLSISFFQRESPTAAVHELTITSVQANPNIVPINGISRLSVVAKGESVTYQWKAESGSISSGPMAQSTVDYRAPEFTTRDKITVTVRDIQGHSAAEDVFISVVQP
jgi:hypothetical protein